MSGELCPSVYQIQCVHMFVDTHISASLSGFRWWCRWRHDGTYSCAVSRDGGEPGSSIATLEAARIAVSAMWSCRRAPGCPSCCAASVHRLSISLTLGEGSPIAGDTGPVITVGANPPYTVMNVAQIDGARRRNARCRGRVQRTVRRRIRRAVEWQYVVHDATVAQRSSMLAMKTGVCGSSLGDG